VTSPSASSADHALRIARALDQAEADAAEYAAAFQQILAELKLETGYEFVSQTFWGRSVYSWVLRTGNYSSRWSIGYSSRAEALTALLSDEIKWIR